MKIRLKLLFILFITLEAYLVNAAFDDPKRQESLLIRLEPSGLRRDERGDVSTWQNSSSRGGDFHQLKSAFRPKFNDAGPNKFSTARFTGKEYLDSVVIGDLASSAFSFFIVFKCDETRRKQYLYSNAFLRGAGAGSNDLWGASVHRGRLDIYCRDSKGRIRGAIHSISKDWNILNVTLDSSGILTSWLNDSAPLSRNIGQVRPESHFFSRIGAGTTNVPAKAVRAFQGEIAELLVYNEALPESTRLRIINDLEKTYFPDKEPPKLTAVTAIEATSGLTISFSEKLNRIPALNIENYTVHPDIIVTSAKLENQGTGVELTLSSPLSKNTYYRLDIENLEDLYGNRIDGMISEPFQTWNIPSENLLVWLKADGHVKRDDEMGVEAWFDHSGRGNTFEQALTSARPRFVERVLNEFPVIRFDGSGSFLRSGQIPELSSGDFTCFIYFNSDGVANPRTVFQSDYHSDRNRGNGSRKLWGMRVRKKRVFVFARPKSATRPLESGWNSFSMKCSRKGVWNYRLNESKGERNGIRPFTSCHDKLVIGGDSEREKRFFKGEIAELLVYDACLSEADVSLVENYLRNKYESPSTLDSDRDGLPDKWEILHFGNLRQSGTDDLDQDGLSESEEFFLKTNPLSADSDQDELTDKSEVTLGLDPTSSDSDDDGLPDGWEVNNQTNPLRDDSKDDPDNDGLDNEAEYNLGTNPASSDSDDDGLPDGWEVNNNLDPLQDDSTLDPDGDGVSNLDEYIEDTNPNLNDTDTDGDGLPDEWEMKYFGDLVQNADGDPDHDAVSNIKEYQSGTDPTINNTDSDNDGLPDAWERRYFDDLEWNAAADPDWDGLVNKKEYEIGSNPNSIDSDGDGMPDGWEFSHALDVLADDSTQDKDKDGLSNIDEFEKRCLPDDPDTDDDGYLDKYELDHECDPTNPHNYPKLNFILAPSNITVAEGSSTSVEISLSTAPPDEIVVEIERLSGDEDLTLKYPADLKFDTLNWNAPVALEFFAAEDIDALCGQSTFVIKADGVEAAMIVVDELENDIGVTLEGGIGGSVLPEGKIVAPKGSPFVFLAKPDSGYVFDRWEGDVSEDSRQSNPLQVNPEKSIRLKPVFKELVCGGRARLAIDSEKSPWVIVNGDFSGNGDSDIALSTKNNDAPVRFDNLILHVNDIEYLVETFEEMDETGLPTGWKWITGNEGDSLISTRSTQSSAHQNAWELTAANNEAGIWFPDTSSRNNASLGVDIQVPEASNEQETEISVRLNGIRATLLPIDSSRYQVLIGEATDENPLFTFPDPLEAGQWRRLRVDFELFPDTDRDQLDDRWEIKHFNDLTQTGNDDFDGDGISNSQEFLNDFEPAVKAPEVRFKLLENEVEDAESNLVKVEVVLSRPCDCQASVLLKTDISNSSVSIDVPERIIFPAGETSVILSVGISRSGPPLENETTIKLSLHSDFPLTTGTPACHGITVKPSQQDDDDEDDDDDDEDDGDKDNDGLPDEWEMKYFKSLDQSPLDDSDGDGVDNQTELKLGRHPFAGSRRDKTNKLKLKAHLAF